MRLVDPPTDGVLSPIWLDPWGSDPSPRRLTAQAPFCCPPPATSIEYVVSYDSTSPSGDRSFSIHPLRSSLESVCAGCCWHHTIPSSSLSTDSRSAARTGSRSPLVDSARPVVPHCLSVSLAAALVRSVPTTHRESPTSWYNSSDTPCSLFGFEPTILQQECQFVKVQLIYG